MLCRINLWTFRLPGLHERIEDLEPNLDFELERASEILGFNVSIGGEARRRFLDFAAQPKSLWSGNFRDLNAAVLRTATLAAGGRIDLPIVEEEMGRLRALWVATPNPATEDDALDALIGPEGTRSIDPFDRIQLAEVLRTCRASATLSEAGQRLFAYSRRGKRSQNDADRLRKYLNRFSLDWQLVRG